MDNLWMQIKEENGSDVEILQIDTDSLYYVQKQKPDHANMIGVGWGKTKFEHDGECEAFVSLG